MARLMLSDAEPGVGEFEGPVLLTVGSVARMLLAS
jgi:hypothetical protein